jgi:hypothetical protein
MYRIRGVVAVVAWFAVSFGSRWRSLASLTRLNQLRIFNRELLCFQATSLTPSLLSWLCFQYSFQWLSIKLVRNDRLKWYPVGHKRVSYDSLPFVLFKYLAPEFVPYHY